MSAQLPVVIIGAGLAGYMFAKEWRKLDTTTPLIIVTSDEGSFYSKPQLSTALTQQKKPAELVINEVAAMASQLNAQILSQVTVQRIRPDEAIIELTDGSCIAYERLVLALGADKIPLPVIGDAVSLMDSINHLDDYRRFHAGLPNKKQIAIIGAGLVGCELANDLANNGYQITVIAQEARPLATLLPPLFSDLLRQALSEQGVSWRLEQAVTAVNCTASGGYALSLTEGSHLLVDGVLAAVGIRPRIGLAAAAGLVVNRGIVVDQWLATSNPRIFALGDCAEVMGTVKQYIAPLLQCARLLAKNLAMPATREPLHYPPLPIVVKTPALPLVCEPPPIGVAGHWSYEGSDQDRQALFYDATGRLRGFVLAGKAIRAKTTLVAQLAASVVSSHSATATDE